MRATLLNILSLFILVSTAATAFGQKPHEDPKYGKDSAERMDCLKNISLYGEFYKQNNFKDAAKPWRNVYNECPQASKNTFIKGAVIYKNLIAAETNAEIKNKYIDTLMMIYDKRIEIFGEEGLVLGYKGADLYGYKGASSAAQVYPMLKRSCELQGKEAIAATVYMFMQSAIDQYKAKAITGAEVIDAYTLAVETLDKVLQYNKTMVAAGGKDSAKAEKEIPKIETSIANTEALFSESGAANCTDLVNIFEPKFTEMSGNIDWLKKVTKLLNKSECTDQPLFSKSAEALYKLEPSAESAHNLARLFLKKEEYSKAEGYYEEATKLQSDQKLKAVYYYEWSQLAMAQGNYPKVRMLSRESLQNFPNDGRPYLMIGKAYASDAKNIGKESVEHNAVYWAAVDKFKEAKRVDPAIAAQADELIATYSKYFPNKEEAFMFGIQEGSAYTVGGWINETTTARF